MRRISDEEFEEALNNELYQKIMYTAISRYYKAISYDDLYTIKLNALWKSLEKYSDDKGTSFTTYLFNNVIWLCMKHLVAESRHKSRFKNMGNTFGGSYYDDNDTCDILNSLDENLAIVIEQRFFGNMTLKEIGNANGYSHEKANQEIKKGVEKIKEFVIKD